MPAYSWRVATMWSPDEHSASTVVVSAPMPEANAIASTSSERPAPSSSAIACSNERTVGLA